MGAPWFRFYSETLTDRKIDYICRATNQPKALIVGVWATILALANDSPIRGALLLTEQIPLTVQDLALHTGLDAGTMEKLLNEFQRLDMIHLNDCTYHVSNWDKYHPRYKLGSKWQKLRAKILVRDNYICQYCGDRATHVDHIIPRSRGGSDYPFNLVAACRVCNMRKSAKTPEEAGMTFITEVSDDATMA